MATFRHKTIRRFRVGEFEFKNGLLVIKDEKKIESFRKLWSDMPRRDQLGIVEIDEEALAKLEKPMARRVIRGVGDTGKIRGRSSEAPAEVGYMDSNGQKQEGQQEPPAPETPETPAPSESGSSPAVNPLAKFAGLGGQNN